MSRELFAVKHRALQREFDRLPMFRSSAQAEFTHLLQSEWKVRFPKRKACKDEQDYLRLLPSTVWEPTRDRIRREHEELREEVNRNVALLESELADLADRVEPMSGESSLEYDATTEGDYRSQGWSAREYARSFVLIESEGIKHVAPNIRTELELFDRNGVIVYRLKIFVASDLDLAIVRYRVRRIPLVVWVRLAWKHGANPRVYWPMLPHDFESKNGLDYFGGLKGPPYECNPQKNDRSSDRR